MNQLKIVIIFLFLSKPILSISQTKKETEEWLKYNLEKYYRDNINDRYATLWPIERKNHYWTTYQYSFSESYLIICETIYNDFKNSGIEFKLGKKHIIDLKKLKSIEIHKPYDESSTEYIELVFDKPISLPNTADFRKYAVTTFDLENNKRLDDQTSYNLNYYIISGREETIKSQIDERIAKAIVHLASLNGAKIIKKDLF